MPSCSFNERFDPARQAEQDLRKAQRDGTPLTSRTLLHLYTILRNQDVLFFNGKTVEFLDILPTPRDGLAGLARPPINRACTADVTISFQCEGVNWSLLLADREKRAIEWYHGMPHISLSAVPTDERRREWVK